ncbi:MAG: hypothetical protein KDA32_13945, partial [Phycisphaerales bacterium]|nr:hypothetical protein [Phycisphaerales bacterium]
MLLATAVATAEDPARLFPAETKIFIAWDGVFKDWPGVVDRIVEKYPEFVADAFDEDVLAALRLAEDVIRHPGAVGLTRLDMEGDFAVAAFVQPKDAADEKRMLADLEHVLQSSDWEMQDCRLSGHAMRQGVQEGITINWGAVNGHVLFAVGANGLDNVVALIDGSGGASLADDNSYKDAIRRLPPTSDGGVVIYANAQKMMDIIRGGMESVGADAEFVEAILGATGLSSVQYKIIRSSGGWNNWRFDVFARINGPYNGILRAFDQKPLTKEDISLIPEDAYMAYVGNFDLAALWEETLNVISEVEPGMLPTVEGGIEAATPFLGFSIPNDLFPAIGDTWAIYNAPETGGPLGFVMVVDARDPQKLLAAAQRINELIDLGVSNVGARLIKKEMKHNGTTIHYMA